MHVMGLSCASVPLWCPVPLDHAPLCPGGSGGLLALQSVAGQQGLTLLLLVGLDDTRSHVVLPWRDTV